MTPQQRTFVTPPASLRLQEDPTPMPTESVVYGTLTIDGEMVMTATEFTITTGDLLLAALLLVIALELFALVIITQWRSHGH